MKQEAPWIFYDENMSTATQMQKQLGFNGAYTVQKGPHMYFHLILWGKPLSPI